MKRRHNPPHSDSPDIMTWLLIGGAAYLAYTYFMAPATVTAATTANTALVTSPGPGPGVTTTPAPVYTAPAVTYTQGANGADTGAVASAVGTYPTQSDGESVIDNYGTNNPANGVDYASVAYGSYNPNYMSLASGAVLKVSTWNQWRQTYGQQHNDPNVKLAAVGSDPIVSVSQYHSLLHTQGLEGLYWA